MQMCTSTTAVAHVFGGVMSQGGKSLVLEIDEVGPMESMDTVYERSHFTFYDKDKKVMMQGK